MATQENQKTILFISELPENIRDTELKSFFSEFAQDIYMFQLDHNQKLHDRFIKKRKKQGKN